MNSIAQCRPDASVSPCRAIVVRLVAALLAGAVTLGLGACAGVQPWERGTLARPEMQLDPNPLQSGLYEQVYDSKEAASGGAGTAGAGCGCN